MEPVARSALIGNDFVILGLIAATLAAVFWSASSPQPALKKFYSLVPPLLLYCQVWPLSRPDTVTAPLLLIWSLALMPLSTLS